MDKAKLNRLNILFEKAVADQTSLVERKELHQLYQAFIDDGRDKPKATSIRGEYIKLATG